MLIGNPLIIPKRGMLDLSAQHRIRTSTCISRSQRPQSLAHLAAALNDSRQHRQVRQKEMSCRVGVRPMSHRRYDTCPETTPAAPTRPSPMIRANQLEPLVPISAVVLDPDSD